MTVELTRAGPEDIDRLLPLVAAYHAFEQIGMRDTDRRRALMPLLEGIPLGEVWLIGRREAPMGYIAFGLGWSIEFKGPDAFVDEIFLTEAARGHGIGAAVLDAAVARLKAQGVVALHLEVARGNDAAQDFYARHGFDRRDRYFLMTRTL